MVNPPGFSSSSEHEKRVVDKAVVKSIFFIIVFIFTFLLLFRM